MSRELIMRDKMFVEVVQLYIDDQEYTSQRKVLMKFTCSLTLSSRTVSRCTQYVYLKVAPE